MLAILHINIKNSFRMKKKILSGVALALLITAGYGVNKNMNGNENLSNLALSNVEALASGEGPGIGEPGKKYEYVTLFEVDSETRCENGRAYKIIYYDSDCYFSGSIPCPGSYYEVFETGYCV